MSAHSTPNASSDTLRGTDSRLSFEHTSAPTFIYLSVQALVEIDRLMVLTTDLLTAVIGRQFQFEACWRVHSQSGWLPFRSGGRMSENDGVRPQTPVYRS